MEIDDLSPELKEKARKCATPEEMIALAREEGFELSDAQLEMITGGESSWSCIRDCDPICPEHGYSPL